MSHRYLVLGLLSEKPMTGYEIKKRAGSALKSVTNASYGTLYPTLHRLLEDGAVRMEEHIQNQRPARKVYAITERGQQELKQWLQQPPNDDQVRREFLLKLFMARHLEPDSLKTLLLQRRESSRARLDSLERLRTTASASTPPNQVWVTEYDMEMIQTELKWLDRLIAGIGAAT